MLRTTALAAEVAGPSRAIPAGRHRTSRPASGSSTAIRAGQARISASRLILVAERGAYSGSPGVLGPASFQAARGQVGGGERVASTAEHKLARSPKRRGALNVT